MGSGDQLGAGVSELSAVQLAALLGTDDQPYLLDVRQPEEVAQWAIPGVVNVPLGELPQRLSELPADRQVVVICASGNRSTQATAWLTERGLQARNLTGGMSSWAQVYDTAVLPVAGGEIVQIRRRAKGCLSYLVGSGNEAMVVDPSREIDVYISLAHSRGWEITRVFDSHLHADHLSGARSLAAHTGASLHLSPFDTFEFDFQALHDSQQFTFSSGLEVAVAVVRTPGHTEGSVMFMVGDEAVLTGDTLFVDGVGRPDLAERAEEFARNLHRSLREKVLVLDDEVSVLPAHYGVTTRVVPGEPITASIGTLRVDVPALSLDEESFVLWATQSVNERPPNYVELIRANMGRSTLELHSLAELEAGPNRCSI